MKTLNAILVCSALVLLVGCGSDSPSSNDPQASTQKPALKAPIADSAPSKIGISSTTEVPAGTKKKN